MAFPSVLTSRKIATAQSSSLGYESTGMSSDDENNDEEKVTTTIPSRKVDNNESKQQRQRRKRRRSQDSSFTSILKQQNNAAVIFLFLGLIFCLLDCIYIIRYVSSMHETIHASSGHIQISEQGNDSKRINSKKYRAVETIPSDWPEHEIGKEPIVRLLKEATGEVADTNILDRLPTAQQVTELYGRDPVVLGLDTCDKFQSSGSDPAEHFVSTAGTFNTGTNLMAELLIANCQMPARMQKYGTPGVRWQVCKYFFIIRNTI